MISSGFPLLSFGLRKREGQKGVKEGKCFNGKEGVLSADPSAYDENGKKKK